MSALVTRSAQRSGPASSFHGSECVAGSVATCPGDGIVFVLAGLGVALLGEVPAGADQALVVVVHRLADGSAAATRWWGRQARGQTASACSPQSLIGRGHRPE